MPRLHPREVAAHVDAGSRATATPYARAVAEALVDVDDRTTWPRGRRRVGRAAREGTAPDDELHQRRANSFRSASRAPTRTATSGTPTATASRRWPTLADAGSPRRSASSAKRCAHMGRPKLTGPDACRAHRGVPAGRFRAAGDATGPPPRAGLPRDCRSGPHERITKESRL